jgi:hypothetical protein
VLHCCSVDLVVLKVRLSPGSDRIADHSAASGLCQLRTRVLQKRSCGLGRSGWMAQTHCVSQTRADLATGGEASWCSMSTSSACAAESEKNH